MQSHHALPKSRGKPLTSHNNRAGAASMSLLRKKSRTHCMMRGDVSNMTSDQTQLWGGMKTEEAQYGTGLKARKQLTNQVTASTLAHITDARKRMPIQNPPPVKSAKYRLSVRSSVSRAQSGKMEQLGSFVDRAQAIFNTNQSTQHLYYQHNQSPEDFDSYQVQVQPRGNSSTQLRDMRVRSAHNYSSMRPTVTSGMISSAKIRDNKHSKEPMTSLANYVTNIASGQNGPAQPARHRSAMQRKGQRSTLQKLLIASDQRDMNPVIDYGRDIQIDDEGALELEDTRNLLERQALMYGGPQKALKGGRIAKESAEMRVICATESQDQRIKLVVVEHCFSEVIRAMYNNDQQRANESSNMSPNAATSSQKAAEPDSIAQFATETEFNEMEMRKHVSTLHRPVNSDSTINLTQQALSAKQASTSAAIDPQKSFTDANSTNAGAEQINAPKEQRKSSVANESEQVPEKGRSIKMMDTITFKDEFQPIQWIFTDLMGKIQSKEISQISINEVIKAFLINLNHNKKTDFNNDDLMLFLDKQQIDQKICFAIKGQKRELLDIKDLLDLRKKYPKGIDALQLFKIPTRSFLPFYFHHILAFDKMGRPVRSTLIRLPIKDVQSQMEPSALQAAMSQLKSRSGFVQDRILQVSNDVVARLTEVSPVVLLNIIIVYLLEEEKFEPWFIGTEKCEVLTQKITHKRKTKNKNQMMRVRDNSTGPLESSTEFRSSEMMHNTRLTALAKENCKSQNVLGDAPAQIRIIETDLANLNSGGIRMNRGGRTPSTTTVFQKLDSRSHVTTQKNEGMAMNDEDRYLMMLNGSEDNGITAYRDKQRPGVAMRRQTSQENRIHSAGQELSQSGSGSKQSLMRERKHNRPKTQIINNGQKKKGSATAQPSQLNQQDFSQQRLSYQPTDGMSYAFGELGTPHELYQNNIERIENISGAESSFSKQPQNLGRQQTSQDEESPHVLTQIDRQQSYHQSRKLSDKEAPFGPNFYNGQSQRYQQPKDSKIIQQSDLDSSKFINTTQVIHGTALAQGEPEQEALQQILNNNTVIENLREGVLFQAECPPPDENLIVHVVKEFKQRGKSAMIGGRRSYKKTASQHSFVKQSELGINSASYFSRDGVQQRNIQDQNVYLLQSNELLTENELFTGLARIGNEYGREAKNITKARQLTTGSGPKPGTSIIGSRHNSQARMTNASRIAAFLNRQDQLQAVSQETKAQRLLPKAHDNRIMNLFPQFLDKSASRYHAKFLFGDSEQAKVFRNYRNAKQSQETKVKNLDDCMLPQEVIRDELKMFGVTRLNQYGTKVFDFKTSDFDEKQFIEQIISGQSRTDENSSRAANDTRPLTPQSGNFGQQNTDLASLGTLNKGDGEADFGLTVGYQQEKAQQQHQKQQVHADAPDVTTSMNMKGRDFLADTLLESRKAFNKQSEAHTLYKQMDKRALAMLEAEKKLTGVVVSDPERVIEDFYNTKLYKPAPGPGDYNLVGHIPKVNSELASKYVEMKQAIRQQKVLQEAQQRNINTSYSQANYRSAGGSSKPRSTKNRTAAGHLNQQMHQPQQLMQGGRRAQQSAKNRGNPRIQINMIEQNKQRGTNYPDSATNEALQEMKLQEMFMLANQTDGVGHIGIGGDGIGQQEMVIDTQIRASEHPASIDTIDQVNSMHRNSIENSGPLGFKCSMNLCCDNTNIVLSEAMQVEDICYIQQGELSKAKSYLIDEKRSEETIVRYLSQFQLPFTQHEQYPATSLLQNADLHTSSVLMQAQLLSQDQTYNDTQVILQKDSNNSSAIILQTPVVGSEQQQQEITSSGTIIIKSRYQELTKRIIEETYRPQTSTPSIQQACMHGKEVVKRLARAVLDDCYGVPTAQTLQFKSPPVNSKTKAAAQSILKPIEDFSVKNPQIFKHERVSYTCANKEATPQQQQQQLIGELNSVGKSTLEVSKGGSTPDVLAMPHKRHMSEMIKPSSQTDGATGENQPVDLKLSQLGIRHVKLDQENWVPSPELVPCCVRCFSIATFVLNTARNSDEDEVKPKQPQQQK